MLATHPLAEFECMKEEIEMLGKMVVAIPWDNLRYCFKKFFDF